MKTKFNEEIESTVDFSVMRGKFLAKRLLRGWKENFTDEDSGEIIALERNELIFEKGTALGESELGVINFHLQAGDISEVVVSNQQRSGNLIERSAMVWQVTANYGNKKYNLYLYATSIEKSIEISTDYLEQTTMGGFSFVAIKELDFSTLIPEDFGKGEENENDVNDLDHEEDYYKIEVAISEEEDFEHYENFIVKASNAESAKETIIKFLHFKRAKDENEDSFIVTIMSAKTIPCDYVIDYEFSMQYLDNGIEAEEV